jgi:hypothetical protein
MEQADDLVGDRTAQGAVRQHFVTAGHDQPLDLVPFSGEPQGGMKETAGTPTRDLRHGTPIHALWREVGTDLDAVLALM